MLNELIRKLIRNSEQAREVWPDGPDGLAFWEFPDGTRLPAIMGAADKPFRFGPVALTTTLTTNIYNPPAGSGGVGGPAATNQYAVLSHIKVVNKHASIAAKFSLYIGATGANAAGTEFMGLATPVPVGSFVEQFGRTRMDVADFLVGGADTATALTIEGEGVLAVV